ncbi:MAG: hypothetical protein JKY95_08260 [Planctomycetaceae bacterium]|nr:hypothetical protein [Planctomycetaceae bacterium]
MNRITSSATLFLLASMFAVGTAVAYPTVKHAFDNTRSVANSSLTAVETEPTRSDILVNPIVSNLNASIDDHTLALADEEAAPAPSIAEGTSLPKVAPRASYWTMKFVQGIGDLDITQLPPVVNGRVILLRKGILIGSFPIGPGGIAQVPRFSPGVYSIIIKSEGGICALGTYLDSKNDKNSSEIVVRVALVPAQLSAVVESLLARAKQDHRGLTGIRKAYHFENYTSFVSRKNVVERGPNGVTRIRLIELFDDYGSGHTTQGLSVHFISNDKIVSHGVTDEDGIAELQGLEQGRYAMVVTGQQRVLVLSVLVRDQVGNALESAISVITDLIIGSASVGMNQNVNTASGGTIPQSDYEQANQGSSNAPNGPTGSAFGGGGGSGGGGGGGSGGGGFLGAAALGGAIGYLLSNDDSLIVSPAL